MVLKEEDEDEKINTDLDQELLGLLVYFLQVVFLLFPHVKHLRGDRNHWVSWSSPGRNVHAGQRLT